MFGYLDGRMDRMDRLLIDFYLSYFHIYTYTHMANMEGMSKMIEDLREEMRVMRRENVSLKETVDILSNKTERGSQSDSGQTVGRNEASGNASQVSGMVKGKLLVSYAGSLLTGMPYYHGIGCADITAAEELVVEKWHRKTQK
jgi:hypothetical protein